MRTLVVGSPRSGFALLCSVISELLPMSPLRLDLKQQVFRGVVRNLDHYVATAIENFFDDLRAHDAGDNLIMMLFTEFGRRVHDNGTGTDHGAGGVAFVIGNRVKGGMYSEYPSLKPTDLQQGDLVPNYDFRGFYATVVEKWLGLDPVSIVGGNFEQLDFI